MLDNELQRTVANCAMLAVGLLVVLGAMAWSWSDHQPMLFAGSFAMVAAVALCLLALGTWNIRAQNALAAADVFDHALVARLRRRAWWGEAANFVVYATLVAFSERRDDWSLLQPMDVLLVGVVVLSAVTLVRNRRHAFD